MAGDCSQDLIRWRSEFSYTAGLDVKLGQRALRFLESLPSLSRHLLFGFPKAVRLRKPERPPSSNRRQLREG